MNYELQFYKNDFKGSDFEDIADSAEKKSWKEPYQQHVI